MVGRGEVYRMRTGIISGEPHPGQDSPGPGPPLGLLRVATWNPELDPRRLVRMTESDPAAALPPSAGMRSYMTRAPTVLGGNSM